MIAFLIALALLAVAAGVYCLSRKGKTDGIRGPGHHDGSVFSIDVMAYASGIGKWNPGFKVGLSVLMLLICVISNNLYVSVLVILMTAFITVVMGRISLHSYLDLMLVPLVFIFLGSVALLVNFSAEYYPARIVINCHYFYIFITEQGMINTLFLWGKVFGAVSAMYMMSLSTPSTEIFSVLRRCHLPKLFIELMYMIYRYIFILLDTHTRMKNAAESRLGYVDFKTSLMTFGQTMGNLLIVSMKKANSYFDAMEARCYDGELCFLEEDKPLTFRQLSLGAFLIILLCAVWLLG